MSFSSVTCGDLSTAVLLAFADGDLGLFLAWKIRRHLRRCWACRTRLKDLNETMHTAQEELGLVKEFDSRDSETAKWNFWQAVQRHSLPVGSSRFRTPRFVFAISALAGSMALLVIFLKHPTQSDKATPLATLAVLQRVERQAAQTDGYRQEFKITFSGRNNSEETRTWHLIAAPRRQLLKSVVDDSSGKIEQAAYRVNPATVSLYSRATGFRQSVPIKPEKRLSLADAIERSFGGHMTLEAALLAWVENQSWHAVSLAREMAEFQSDRGAALAITRNMQGCRIVASGFVHQVRIYMTLETSSEATSPRLMEVAWSESGNARLVRISRVESVTYRGGLLRAADFRPDPSLLGQKLRARQPALTITEPAISPNRLAMAEVDVLHTLHAIGLCEGGLQVLLTSRGVQVAGVVSDEATRQQLRELFESLPERGLIQLAIESSAAVPVLSGHTSKAQSALAESPAPAEAWLRQQLQGRKITERDLFDVMNTIVSAAQKLSAEAAAVRALASRFPASRETLLPLDARQTLLQMVNDHAAVALGSIHKLQQTFSTLGVPPPDAGPTQPGTFGWQEGALGFQHQAGVIAAQMLDLFSSHSGAPSVTQSDLIGQVAQAQTAIRGGLICWRQLDAGLDTEMNRDRAQMRVGFASK